MPFIRVNRIDGKTISVQVSKVIQFYELGGNTRVDLVDNISHDVKDTTRQLRGYINKAEGLLEDRQEYETTVGAPAETLA